MYEIYRCQHLSSWVCTIMILIHFCVSTNFITYRFLSVTIVSIINWIIKIQFKYLWCTSDRCYETTVFRKLNFMGAVRIITVFPLPVILLFHSKPLHFCITHCFFFIFLAFWVQCCKNTIIRSRNMYFTSTIIITCFFITGVFQNICSITRF
jgi:hypothetical protein